jgi:hypothetical protein
MSSVCEPGREAFGSGFGAGDTLGDSNAIVRVSSESERGKKGDKLLAPGNAPQVADVILRHRAGPAGDVFDERCVTDPQKFAELDERQSAELNVAEREQLGLKRAANEHANQHRIRGSSTWEFLTGKAGRNDAAAFDSRDDEAEAIERMGDLTAPEAEADNRAAGVLDCG